MAVLHPPRQLCIHGNPLKSFVGKEFPDWAWNMMQLFLGFQLVSLPVPHDLEVAPLPSIEIIWEMSVRWNFNLCIYHYCCFKINKFLEFFPPTGKNVVAASGLSALGNYGKNQLKRVENLGPLSLCE